MFVVRENLATNDELLRQKNVCSVILQGKLPTTYLEKNAAALIGHKTIDPLVQARVYSSLNRITTLLTSKHDLEKPVVLERVREIVRNTRLTPKDRVRITCKPPVLTLHPDKIETSSGSLDTETSTNANLTEFEYLCFRNNIRYRYMVNTNFATYMYQNLLHYLQIESNVTKSLEACNDVWQSRLATLIATTDFDVNVVMAAFYRNTVEYDGAMYDTSFVPKYDVKAIQPQESIDFNLNDGELVEYYNALDERSAHTVPDNKMAIFLTFPFKNGHHIRPNGKIVYLNIDTYRCRRSAKLVIQELCSLFDIETAVDSAARLVSLDNAIYYAVYAENLKQQAMALLILRRLVGDTVTIDTYTIDIPSELNVLSWLRLSCSNTNIVLPPIRESKSLNNSLVLIRDIANSCFSQLGASILCSSFCIPEIDMGALYTLLETDAQKYVFFTFVLQEYPLHMYLNARRQLDPAFGNNSIDLSAHVKCKRSYSNTTIGERLDMLSEPLLKPSDVNNEVTLCNPYKCTEIYEFSDPQLNGLVRTGDVQLNDVQLSNFIALFV